MTSASTFRFCKFNWVDFIAKILICFDLAFIRKSAKLYERTPN
jgi:hypothetical protein